MNIKVAQLQAKPFSVKGSVKNLKKTFQFQLDMAESEEKMESLEGVESLKAILDLQELVENYLTATLRLSAKQVETLEDLGQQELMEVAQYVAMRVMGMSDEDIKATMVESDDEGLDQIPENE